jgi:ribosomal protein S18 acetylase RimI-like enzyme
VQKEAGVLNEAGDVQLRRFAPPDAASIIAWPQSPAEAQWWAGAQAGWPLSIEALERWHADPDIHPYVLAGAATLLGYGELWIDAEEHEVELARLIVAPEQRGRGFGVALALALLRAAGRTNYPRAFLRVAPDNHVAVRCYRRAGFTPLSPAEQALFNQGQPIDYLWMGGCVRNARGEQPTSR